MNRRTQNRSALRTGSPPFARATEVYDESLEDPDLANIYSGLTPGDDAGSPQGPPMETLLTVGLIGSLAAAVTAMHLHLTARPIEPAPIRRMDDIDAEFF